MTSVTNSKNVTMCSNFQDDENYSIRMIIKIFTILISILGTLGNGFTIAAIVRGKHYLQACNIFILNLNVCNFLHCLICLPLLATQTFDDIWTYNLPLCSAVSYLIFCTLGIELWALIFITVNRYYCVVNFPRYLEIYGNNKIIAAQIIVTWTFYPIIFLLPLAGLWSSFQYSPPKLICHPFHDYQCNGFCILVFTIALVTTVPTIVYCYASIIINYIRIRKRVDITRRKESPTLRNSNCRYGLNAVSNVTTIVTSDSGARGSYETLRSRLELRMAFIILAILMVFSLGRLPFIVLYLYDPSMTRVSPLTHTVIIYMGANSNWINPIIYSLLNTQIRDTLKKFLFCYEQICNLCH